MTILTKDMLEAGKSIKGQWGRLQLWILGINVLTCKPGWMKTIIGKNYTDERIHDFLALKDKHLANNKSPMRSFKKKYNFPERQRNKKSKVSHVLLPSKTDKTYNVSTKIRSAKWEYDRQSEYFDSRWQVKRAKVIIRDEGKCKLCGSSDKIIHVHHMFYYRDFPIWAVEEEFLITLCDDCHKAAHSS